MTPLIADLSEKCKIVAESLPTPPEQPASSQASGNNLYPQLPQQQTEPPRSADSLASLLDLLTQKLIPVTAAPMETTTTHSEMQSVPMEQTDNEPQLVDIDSDVEVLYESESQPIPPLTSAVQTNAQEQIMNASTTTAISIDHEPAYQNPSGEYQMDSEGEEGEEWMLVSKSSYKHLCDFYEKRRKAQHIEGDEEEEEQDIGTSSAHFAQANAPVAEEVMSTQSSQAFVAERNGVVHLPSVVGQVPASLLQANPAAARVVVGSAPAIPEKGEDADSCYAGMPYYNPLKPHNKSCYMRHASE
jgi:hypothetical protein